MFKSIDIWKTLDDSSVIRYRCFQRLRDGQFCIQSADLYNLPLREEQIRFLDKQFLELFIEEPPDRRSSLHATLEEAIATYDLEFADNGAVLSPA
jgi:hypothetical protein